MKSEREIVVPSISNVIILMFPLFRDSKSSCKKDAFMSVSKREESMMNDEMGKNTTKIEIFQSWEQSLGKSFRQLFNLSIGQGSVYG